MLLVESVAFAAGSVAFLLALGLAVTDLTLPDVPFRMLIAPAVGLAVLAIAFQWLTFFVPAFVAVIVIFVIAAPGAAWTLWRRRAALWTGWPDLAGAAVIALGLFVALLQIDLQRGYFTLGGWPSDNVFIYVQAAQYVVNHAMPSALHPATLSNPGTVYLVGTGAAFPNSVGPIDAATSVLVFRPVYTVFDTINALSLALTVGPVWLFVRHALNGTWAAAAGAAAVLATNQLIFWVMGNGFQQESMALPLFATGLAVAAHSARNPSIRSGAVLGGLVAALAGVYLPISVLLVLCALVCALVAAVAVRALPLRAFWAPIAGAAVAGVVAGAPNLYLLLAKGGLNIWVVDSSVRVPAGGVSYFPLLPYVLGALPFAHGWEAGRLPFSTLDRLALPLYAAASGLILVLLVLGLARAVLRGRTVEAALLVAGFLFVGYEAGIAQYPYGYVKSIGYMVPMTSAFIAFGGIGVETLACGAWVRRARLAGVAAVAIILAGSMLASRDMVKLWLVQPDLPTFPRQYISISSLAAYVPEGSTVFVDYPVQDYPGLVKAAAIAYFLPDRNVRVYVGPLRLGTFQDQDQRPSTLCDYGYVIGTGSPGSGFQLVASDPEAGLSVYRRTSACS